MTDRAVEIVGTDYDCHATTSDWRFWLYVEPEARRVHHYSQHGDGTPMPVWHGKATLISLPSNAVGTEILAILQDSECRDLLAQLCDQYEGERWDGSNYVGCWRDDGDDGYPACRHDLEVRIEGLFVEVATYWSASDYLAPVWGQHEADSVRQRLADDGGLDAIADEMVADASRQEATLDADDVRETLESLLAEYPPLCDCGHCDCDEPSTGVDADGNPVCDECARLTTDPDGTVECGRC